MNNIKEYGLFIIWSNARNVEKQIVDDINKKFKIINRFDVEWDKTKFSDNLTRFYGENLPKNSFKEKHCGNEPFLLVIVEDQSPIYKNRPTSKGKKLVNVNFFDSKELYRNWTGGGHKIHATNDVKEFKHDLMMLLGLSVEDYLNKYGNINDVIKLKNNIVGSEGWRSLEQILYVLNETADYVILRNYEYLPEKYTFGPHGDIDILCDSQYNLSTILKAKKETKIKSRVRYSVSIGNSKLYFDIRFIGDNYYDVNYEKKILDNRIIFKCFNVPNNDDYKYSLLYHALVHKKVIASDYIDKFNTWFGTSDISELLSILNKYLNSNGYSYVEPKDISVYFNERNTKKIGKFSRKLYHICSIIDRVVRKVVKK